MIEATAPVFNLKIAEHEFTAPEPLRITLRNGRIEFDSFVLRRTDSVFAVTGFAEITGAKRLDVDVRGRRAGRAAATVHAGRARRRAARTWR